MPKPKGVLNKDETDWCLASIQYLSCGIPKVSVADCPPRRVSLQKSGESTPDLWCPWPGRTHRVPGADLQSQSQLWNWKSAFCCHPWPRCCFSSQGDILAPHHHSVLLSFSKEFSFTSRSLVQIQIRSVVIEIISSTSSSMLDMKWVGSFMRTRYSFLSGTNWLSNCHTQEKGRGLIRRGDWMPLCHPARLRVPVARSVGVLAG